MTLRIVLDDLSGPDIETFLEAHLEQMRATSPPESTHALDLDSLRKPNVTFYSARDDGQLVGSGALVELDPDHVEIKSMRTDPTRRRAGIGAAMLTHLLGQARERGYRRVSLETGSMESFAPARALYQRFGFTECAPFAGYTVDPHSVYLTRTL